ncbi:hypothetical protein EDC04DRAFT_1833915 [Pisolithus marmoratus]|nr:hypothetical protein EDC04DRAFT_1833915 [Pisolithus marmoratus]
MPATMMVAKQFNVVFQSNVNKVTFADDIQVVGGDVNGSIRRWNIEDGQQQGPTMHSGSHICSIAVSQDGQWIVSGDWGGKTIVWNAATHEKVRESTEHGGQVWGIDISRDCTKIVSVGNDTAQIFSMTSGDQLLPPLSHHWVEAVEFSPDGSQFATASYDQGFRVYSTHNGDILFDSGPQVQDPTDSGQVTSVAWSPDGQQLFGTSPGQITCFNISKSSSSEWSIHQTKGRTSIASNGRFIACSAGSSVSLWDCVSHKQISSIITHTAKIVCLALSPSGGFLACGVGRKISIHNLRDVLPAEYFGHGPHTVCNGLIPPLASQLLLVQMSHAALKSWTQGNPMNTEMLLSEEIRSISSPSHYVLASRALIRVRLNHVALAIEDANQSLQVQPSPIGHIAMAVALLGESDRDGALCTFDLAFLDCDPHDIKFNLLLKSILMFECGMQKEVITRVEYLATRASNGNDDDVTYPYTQVLGAMYMRQGDYGRAVALIERAKNLAPKDQQRPPLMTISLIFGWSFDGLDIVAQQHLCDTLYAEARTAEAMKVLLNIVRSSEDKEIQGSKATVEWIADFTKKCATTLEHVGDEAFGSAQHGDGLLQYPSALSFSPSSPAGQFIKWSTARAAKGLWEDALQYANDALKVDPSCPGGYEAKHMALHAMQRYDEAIEAFKSMLHVIEQSDDSAIRQLRKSYISPSETIATIDHIVRGILEGCPLVVIDVVTGYLCDGPERIHIFKASPTFKELVSSMTRELDNKRIRRVVASFFGYVMFSHAWQGPEPLYQNVKEAKSVWDLPDMPLNEKLRNFCKESRRLGHNWAWSDTCCIDKTTSSILNQSLTSMYKWYADSAATIVFLAGVAHPPKLGDLTSSIWTTRAWTLQELLAPKVVIFYDSKWKPYLGDTGANHKESPQIMQELADAIKIPRGTIVTFSPDDLGVREKLRLASTRNATVKEDVAYSLIGIFKSDIRPHYGEGADALGHLLEEIVARSGEVTVLAWSGKSSSYNSCLPASVSVYSRTSYIPPLLEGEAMEACVTELRGKLPQREALDIYDQINTLPLARFATRRLHLPCIVFPIRAISIQGQHRREEMLCRAKVSGLGNVEFMTTDDIPLDKWQKFVLVHPWIRHIRGPSSEPAWEDDSELDTDSDLGSGSDAGSDGVVLIQSAPTPRVGDYTRALHMIARLGQPFNALLLVQQSNGDYRRVAAENEIVVSGLGTNITSRNIRAKVLEIL